MFRRLIKSATNLLAKENLKKVSELADNVCKGISACVSVLHKIYRIARYAGNQFA